MSEEKQNCNTGDWNTGNRNTGNRNTGNRNTGDWNTGNRNTGNWNTGNRNTGDCNTGDCNTGDWNTGYWNTGNRNTGNRNTGDWNTGNRNTGNWNTGNRNTGYFNTTKQDQLFAFNKLCKKSDFEDVEFPDFLYFELIEWIPVATMTAEEKNEHTECDTIGGYLKQNEYKEAFRKSFEKAKQKEDWKAQLALLKKIPNFDAEIFAEISGIQPEELED